LLTISRTPIFTAVTIAKYADFYNAPTSLRPFKVVTPSIWTLVVINISLITACLPSIKRWLTDWAAGVANAGVREPWELQNSSGHGDSRSSPMSGLRSFAKSQVRSGNMSKSGKETPTMDVGYSPHHYGQGRAEGEERVVDDGDSKKGLTDGILQTVDYHVEYERDRDDGLWDGSEREGRRSKM